VSQHHDVLTQPKAQLIAALEGAKLSFATAESCTGGQLAALLAADVALGPHLERGFVVYSADAKCELLDVDRADAERCEAVNPEVAEALAMGALANSRADVAVAITGFCGPQEKDEEVGLVYLACAPRDGPPVLQECHFGDIGRQLVLDHAVAAALALLTEAVGRRHAGSLKFGAC
jgi:nicotinamide-nucleotide amidase